MRQRAGQLAWFEQQARVRGGIGGDGIDLVANDVRNPPPTASMWPAEAEGQILQLGGPETPAGQKGK